MKQKKGEVHHVYQKICVFNFTLFYLGVFLSNSVSKPNPLGLGCRHRLLGKDQTDTKKAFDIESKK